MKGHAFRESVLIIILLLIDASHGDPRFQTINITCNRQLPSNQSAYIPNSFQSMEKISPQLQSSKSGTSSTGSGPNSSYALAECYGDLSLEDCLLCYAEAQRLLPTCFPNNGGRVFLDGCFARTQDYSFYQEYAGVDDTVICGNTKRSRVFRDSVRQTIADAVRDAPRSWNYFARKQALSDTANNSAYVLADCWNTLNDSSCTECLDSAFASILKCLPLSEGRALHTGCFLRYSDTNFLNPESTETNSQGMNGKYYQVVPPTCGNERVTSANFIPAFVQAMERVSSKINESKFGVASVGATIYALSQCYGDIPITDCQICYAIGRTTLPRCLSSTGGRVYFNSCFLRYETYSFFEEYIGQEDRSICPNNIRRNNAFEQSVRKAVAQAVETAPKSNNYHARIQILITGTENESVYAQADCLRTLNAGSCEKCLQEAAESMLDCLPGSEGEDTGYYNVC